MEPSPYRGTSTQMRSGGPPATGTSMNSSGRCGEPKFHLLMVEHEMTGTKPVAHITSPRGSMGWAAGLRNTEVFQETTLAGPSNADH